MNNPRSITSTLTWNSNTITQFWHNRKIFRNVFWNGIKVIEITSLPAGLSVHYGFNPDSDYLTDSDGIRYTKDTGNTPEKYHGEMNSGSSIDIMGTVDIPGTPTIYVFDYSTHSFISTTSPISGKIGMIICLMNNTFTPGDIDIFNDDPDMAVKWALGGDAGISIVKEDVDKIYCLMEQSGETLKEITEDPNDDLQIVGEYTRQHKEIFGPQKLRFYVIQTGVPTQFIDSEFIRCNAGAFVDTGVPIDGGNNNFAMMLQFMLPEIENNEYQFLASASQNDEKLFIYHEPGTPLNQIFVGIGKTSINLTLDESLYSHAMCVSFDVINSKIQFGIDGSPLSAPYDISFTSTTSPMILGAYNDTGDYGFLGYLGEGILTSNVISEQDWLDFWNSVKDRRPLAAPENINCGEYYNCDDNWGCPAPLVALDCNISHNCDDYSTC